MSLQYLHTIRNHDLPLTVRAVAPVISLAAERNEAKLAIDLASWYEARHPEIKLPKHIWMDCLVASEFTRYVSPLFAMPFGH
jgi:hypothetical protein